jgi:large subunit ribosomal protein L29
MPILRIKEIRDMSSENRTGKLHEFRTELLRLKTMIGAGGTVENPARVKALRKAIAKILTVEHEEKRGIRKAEPKKEPKKKEPKKTEPKKTEPRKRKKT